MRKEVVVAVITGSVLGLVIAFGAWRVNSFLKVKDSSPKTDQTDTSSKEPSPNLAIASPEENSVLVDSEVTINGITKQKSIVLFSGEDEDIIVVANSQGAFEGKVALVGGINIINISSFDPADGSSQKKLTLVYSSEFSKFMSEEVKGDSDSTEEADPIRAKVQEKVLSATNKPMGYLGSITDITENGLQIKNKDGQILQVSLGEDTEYANIIKETKKQARTDLAIGDFVAALGFKDANNILSAKRVLITTQPSDSSISFFLGVVQKIEKKAITIKTNDQKEILANFGKSWDGPNLTELEVGQSVIVVGELSGETLSNVRTLHIVEEK